jgi:hypothetical protein
VQLPDLGIPSVKAKVDTGARSSALHAIDVEIDEQAHPPQVSFTVTPLPSRHDRDLRCRCDLHDRRWVRSSNGTRELRPVIRTRIRLLDDVWPIDLTLTSRHAMGFRMLLGREAIRGRFLVNPGLSYRDPSFVPESSRRKKRR